MSLHEPDVPDFQFRPELNDGFVAGKRTRPSCPDSIEDSRRSRGFAAAFGSA